MNLFASFIGLLSILLLVFGAILVSYNFLYEIGLVKNKLLFKAFHSFPKFNQLQHAPFIKISLLCIITRVTLYFTAYLSYMLINNQRLPFSSAFTTLFSKWDGNHYIYIAQNWYANQGDPKFLIVFFPLYPILIKIFSFIFHDFVLSAIMVSNISLIGACMYLYKLALLDYDSETGFRSIKYLLIFPVSFFLSITYSESLFIFLSCGCFYYSRKNKWQLASIFAFLACLTRSMGVLLMIPMLIELLFAIKTSGGRTIKDYLKVLTTLKTTSIFSPILALFIYMYINFKITGSFTTFLKYQKEHWNQTFGLYFKNIVMMFKNALDWKAADSASLWVPQLLIIFMVLFLLTYSSTRLRSSYTFYMLFFFVMAVSPTWLLSAPRYFLSLFPIFIALAILGRRKMFDTAITFLFIMGLCFCTIAFVTGHFIM